MSVEERLSCLDQALRQIWMHLENTKVFGVFDTPRNFSAKIFKTHGPVEMSAATAKKLISPPHLPISRLWRGEYREPTCLCAVFTDCTNIVKTLKKKNEQTVFPPAETDSWLIRSQICAAKVRKYRLFAPLLLFPTPTERVIWNQGSLRVRYG